MNAEYLQLRIGLIGLGLEAYWSQFQGLQQRLTGYLGEVEARIAGESRRVVNFGLVDTPERAFGVGHACRKEDIDLLVVYVTTYALSSVLLPIIRLAKVPVLLLNLQPTPANRLRRIARSAGSHRDDGRVARVLQCLPRSGVCQRPATAGATVLSGYRRASRRWNIGTKVFERIISNALPTRVGRTQRCK
jgi:hypothetical protein